MSAPSRIAALARADFLIRFRRPSTLVVFLLTSSLAYLWIPDPSTGRALLQLEGRRAIYNSGAIGMATALIGCMFIGLFGFYVISNAIGRDVRSRCGSIIAATGVRSSEYLFGKFLGNVLFLSTFTFGFMLSSMAMLLVRAEAPLEPWIFAKQYLLLTPPAIVFVSVLGVVFESVKFLSGRFGDVVYFFLWLTTMGGAAAVTEKGGANFAEYFDYSGFAFTFQQLKVQLKTQSLSIGSSPFDASKPPFVFGGLVLGDKLVSRVVATLSALPLLLVARMFFHRFDPARVKAGVARQRAGILAKLSGLVAPLARLLTVLLPVARSGGIVGQGWNDARLTFALAPLAVVGLVGFGIAALVAPAKAVMNGVVPIALAGVAVLLSDVASRDFRQGTLPGVFAAPHVRERFALWKAVSMLFTAVLCLAFPLVRLALVRPQSLVAMLAGVIFTIGIANLLSIVTKNPKTMIVLFLSFWYLVMNDKGMTPKLDFAGFWGVAPPAVIASYALAGIAAVVVAQVVHGRELER